MRFLYLDQFEIDDPASEQTLAIAIVHQKRFDGFESFFKATCHLPEMNERDQFELPVQSILQETEHGDMICRFYERETELRLPSNVPLFVLEDEWNYFDALLKVDEYYSRIVWFMTA